MRGSGRWRAAAWAPSSPGSPRRALPFRSCRSLRWGPSPRRWRAALRGERSAIVGALVGHGIPEERAKVYERGINEGGIVFGVNCRNDEDAEFIERGWTDARGEQIYRSGLQETGRRL